MREAECILVLDPGETTGWSLWQVEPDLEPMRLDYGAIQGGLEGFIAFMRQNLVGMRASLVICERFNEKDGRVAVADLVPLPIQGAIATMCDAFGIPLRMQGTDFKAMCRDEVLMEHGLWLEGADVDWKDARDTNDTQIHLLAYLKSMDHEPTVTAFWPDEG